MRANSKKLPSPNMESALMQGDILIKNECYLLVTKFRFYYDSFSVSGNHSGVTHDATAFVGCSQNQVRAKFGKSGT